MMRIIGVIQNPQVIEHWGSIRTNVVLTDERILHIVKRHQADYEQYGTHIPDVISLPDVILEDHKHSNTAMFIRHIEETNVNVIVKIACSNESSAWESSVITMYRLSEKKKEKIMRQNVIIYKG